MPHVHVASQQLMMQQYAMQMQQMQPGAPQQVHMPGAPQPVPGGPGQPGQPQQQVVMVGPNGQIMHQVAGHYLSLIHI